MSNESYPDQQVFVAFYDESMARLMPMQSVLVSKDKVSDIAISGYYDDKHTCTPIYRHKVDGSLSNIGGDDMDLVAAICFSFNVDYYNRCLFIPSVLRDMESRKFNR